MSADQDWKGLYRAGGASLLIMGVLYIIGFYLFFQLGGLPTSGQAALTALSAQKLLAQITITTFAATDFLFIPAVFAFYIALKGVRRTYALIASGLAGLFIVLDLGVNTVNFFSLVALGDKYAVATTEAQRATYVATADLTLGAVNVGLPLAGLAFAVGVLVFGLAMLKGVFNKPTAYLTMIVGIVGIIGTIPIPALAFVFVVTIILGAVWFLVVGFKLYRLV